MVFDNLRHAFPEKSDAEIKRLAKGFYRNLCDQIVEFVKMFDMDVWTVISRNSAKTDNFSRLHKEGKSVIVALGHQFNWEWSLWLCNKLTWFEVIGVYTKVTNKTIERLVNEARMKYGATMTLAENLQENMERVSPNPTMTILIGDQNPSNFDKAVWLPFFNRMVPFHTGTERLARKLGHSIVFVQIIRKGRGKYHIDVHEPYPNGIPDEFGIVTAEYAKFLETSIRNQPENYVWSHNRWKHTNKYPQPTV